MAAKDSPEPDGPTVYGAIGHLCDAQPCTLLKTLQQRCWLCLRYLRFAMQLDQEHRDAALPFRCSSFAWVEPLVFQTVPRRTRAVAAVTEGYERQVNSGVMQGYDDISSFAHEQPGVSCNGGRHKSPTCQACSCAVWLNPPLTPPMPRMPVCGRKPCCCSAVAISCVAASLPLSALRDGRTDKGLQLVSTWQSGGKWNGDAD